MHIDHHRSSDHQIIRSSDHQIIIVMSSLVRKSFWAKHKAEEISKYLDPSGQDYVKNMWAPVKILYISVVAIIGYLFWGGHIALQCFLHISPAILKWSSRFFNHFDRDSYKNMTNEFLEHQTSFSTARDVRIWKQLRLRTEFSQKFNINHSKSF